eukprot:348534_1
MSCPPPFIGLGWASRARRKTVSMYIVLTVFWLGLMVRNACGYGGWSAMGRNTNLWRGCGTHVSAFPQSQLLTRGRQKNQRLTSLMMAADYYKTLGVSNGASQREIKSAFRQAARKYHPDVNPDPKDTEKFKQITSAYEVLSDENMRARYDQFGEAGLGGGAGMGEGFEVDLSDIFDSFFGGGGGRGGARRRQQTGPVQGDDLRADLTIQFNEACFGTETKLRIRHLEACETCGGNGVKPGAKVSTCSQCNGQGAVVQMQKTPLGTFQTQMTCPKCRGEGKQVEEHCGACSGQGAVEKSKQTKVRVPAGIDDGAKLRIRGEGDAGPRGGPPGDLYVFVKVKSNPNFTRKGRDIHSTHDMDYLDAILGDLEVPIEVVDGSVQIKVPAGTQPGTILRVRGKGAPRLRDPSSRGDHYVTINVKLPTSISKEEKELLESLRLKNKKGGGSNSIGSAKKGRGGFGLFSS